MTATLRVLRKVSFGQNARGTRLATIALLVCTALLALPVAAQAGTPELTNSGKEFWLGFTENLGTPDLTLYITGETATTGTVEIKGESFSEAFTVTPGTVTAVKIPAQDAMATSDGIEEKAIHVTAGAPVVVYGLNDIPYTTDAYTAFPDEVDGDRYTVLAFGWGLGGNSELGVVATQNDTEVTITPSVDGGTGDSRPAGVPYTITLNQGQEYQLQATTNPEDLTGTQITSTAPVSVFGGEQCANIPTNDYVACDYIVEQNAPDYAWGSSFLTVPLKTRHNGDYFELVADQNGTEVKLNGTVVATLNAGEHYSQEVAGGSEWSSNKPIELGQYSNSSEWDETTGDPSMMLVPPSQQFETGYTITTPVGSETTFANYVNLVVPTAEVGSIEIDHTPVPSSEFSPIGTSGFEGAQLDVAPGSHVITGNGEPFGVFSYGFSEYNAYSYYGGMSVAPLGAENVTLTPAAETAIVNTEKCVTATVTNSEGGVLPSFPVAFTVTGANSASGTVFTGPEGKATFCYKGTQAGSDTITGSVGTISGTATKKWVGAANVALTPATETAVVNTEKCVTATVTSEEGGVLPSFPVVFTVTGANSASGTVFTGSEGKATFCYTGTHAGSDTITGSIGKISGTATKTWVAEPTKEAAASSAVLSLKVESPKACTSKRDFEIHIQNAKQLGLVSAVVKIDGIKKVTLTGKRLTTAIDLVGLPKGTFTVEIVARRRDGRTVRGKRVYHTCVAKLPGHARLYL